MTKMIFVNLSVAELAASKRFYEAVGFTNNPQIGAYGGAQRRDRSGATQAR
jgi:predicted lactoylglutathione lyase